MLHFTVNMLITSTMKSFTEIIEMKIENFRLQTAKFLSKTFITSNGDKLMDVYRS